MMKKRIYATIIVCLAALTTSCKHDHVPDNLIDTATMTAIMTEYYLIDGYDYIVASRRPDSIGYQSRAAKDSMLAKHNITQADYDSSLAYYINHPKVFDILFSRTMQRLESLSQATAPIAGNSPASNR